MKRIYVIIGGLLLTIGLIAISLSHWNTKIDTTTEKSKKEIEVTAKKDPSLTGDAPANDTNSINGKSDVASRLGSDTAMPGSTAGQNSSALAGTENNGTASGNPNNTSISTAAVKTTAEIKADYRKIFSDLEVQEMSNVDQLVVQAKADYVGKKLSKEDLIAKYQDAATALEGNADKAFNMIYQQLEFDLKKYGHDANEAAEFKSEYQAKKQERLLHVVTELQGF